ncbi:hypothetical protein BC937DRAFT_89015 [Endogone sp. FLAS-F59071]|nr:hypothetical protein BC937DRAFT_89015 [Endogone sp. FLAS-F59071]|eukprot:RUS18225.1 hypothetical protein BC937DRAFT_89015 [Endogone sp. FLAS-F59071]
MATKSVDEHRTAINNLLSTLAEIERLANEFFDKACCPYIPHDQRKLAIRPVFVAGRASSLRKPLLSQFSADVTQLVQQLNTLEQDARESGLFSLSSSSPADGQPAEQKNLQTRTQDATRAVDALYKEKERLLKNVQTASVSMAAAGRGM